MLGTEDSTAKKTYAAVGLALSRWEELEVTLAELYAFFIGRPTSVEAVQSFCDANRIFASRLKSLQQAGRRYFVRHPDQELEGLLHEIVDAAEAASLERNRIAHGLVQRVQLWGITDKGEARSSIGYMLLAPWYAMKRLRLEPEHGFGSADINQISEGFLALEKRAMALLALLFDAEH